MSWIQTPNSSSNILTELELSCSLKVSQTQTVHTCLLASDWLVLKLGSEVRCTRGTSHLTCVYRCTQKLQNSEAAGVGGGVEVTCDLVLFQVVRGILQAELPLMQDQLHRLNLTLLELQRNTWSVTGDISYHMIS